jgi:hypothetical protein
LLSELEEVKDRSETEKASHLPNLHLNPTAVDTTYFPAAAVVEFYRPTRPVSGTGSAYNTNGADPEPGPELGCDGRKRSADFYTISLTSDHMRIPVDLPCVPVDDNECCRYATSFQLTSEDEGTQFSLRFEGVDSAFTL